MSSHFPELTNHQQHGNSRGRKGGGSRHQGHDDASPSAAQQAFGSYHGEVAAVGGGGGFAAPAHQYTASTFVMPPPQSSAIHRGIGVTVLSSNTVNNTAANSSPQRGEPSSADAAAAAGPTATIYTLNAAGGGGVGNGSSSSPMAARPPQTARPIRSAAAASNGEFRRNSASPSAPHHSPRQQRRGSSVAGAGLAPPAASSSAAAVPRSPFVFVPGATSPSLAGQLQSLMAADHFGLGGSGGGGSDGARRGRSPPSPASLDKQRLKAGRSGAAATHAMNAPSTTTNAQHSTMMVNGAATTSTMDMSRPTDAEDEALVQQWTAKNSAKLKDTLSALLSGDYRLLPKAVLAQQQQQQYGGGGSHLHHHHAALSSDPSSSFAPPPSPLAADRRSVRLIHALRILGDNMKVYKEVFDAIADTVGTLATEHAELAEDHRAVKDGLEAQLKAKDVAHQLASVDLTNEVRMLKRTLEEQAEAARAVTARAEQLDRKSAEIENERLTNAKREEEIAAARRTQDVLFAQFAVRNKGLQEEIDATAKEATDNKRRADELNGTCQRYAQRVYRLEQAALETTRQHEIVVKSYTASLSAARERSDWLNESLLNLRAMKQAVDAELRDTTRRLDDALEACAENKRLNTPRPSFRAAPPIPQPKVKAVEAPAEVAPPPTRAFVKLGKASATITAAPTPAGTKVTSPIVQSAAVSRTSSIVAKKSTTSSGGRDVGGGPDDDGGASSTSAPHPLVGGGAVVVGISATEAFGARSGGANGKDSSGKDAGLKKSTITIVEEEEEEKGAAGDGGRKEEDFNATTNTAATNASSSPDNDDEEGSYSSSFPEGTAEWFRRNKSTVSRVKALYQQLDRANNELAAVQTELEACRRAMRASDVLTRSLRSSPLQGAVGQPMGPNNMPIGVVVLPIQCPQQAYPWGTGGPSTWAGMARFASARPFLLTPPEPLPLLMVTSAPVIQVRAWSLSETIRRAKEFFDVWTTQNARTTKTVELHTAIAVHLLDTAAMAVSAGLIPSSGAGGASSPSPPRGGGDKVPAQSLVPNAVSETAYSLLFNSKIWSSNPIVATFRAILREEMGVWVWNAQNKFIATHLVRLGKMGTISFSDLREAVETALLADGFTDADVEPIIRQFGRSFIPDALIQEHRRTKSSVDEAAVPVTVDASAFAAFIDPPPSAKGGKKDSSNSSHTTNAVNGGAAGGGTVSASNNNGDAAVAVATSNVPPTVTGISEGAATLALRALYYKRLAAFYARMDHEVIQAVSQEDWFPNTTSGKGKQPSSPSAPRRPQHPQALGSSAGAVSAVALMSATGGGGAGGSSNSKSAAADALLAPPPNSISEQVALRCLKRVCGNAGGGGSSATINSSAEVSQIHDRFVKDVFKACRVQHKLEAARLKEQGHRPEYTNPGGMASHQVFLPGYTAHYFGHQYQTYPQLQTALDLVLAEQSSGGGKKKRGGGGGGPKGTASASAHANLRSPSASPSRQAAPVALVPIDGYDSASYNNAAALSHTANDAESGAATAGGAGDSINYSKFKGMVSAYLEKKGGAADLVALAPPAPNPSSAPSASPGAWAHHYGEHLQQDLKEHVPLVLFLRMYRKVPFVPYGLRTDGGGNDSDGDY